MHPIDQGPELARINEQGFAAAVAQHALGIGAFVAGQEPQAYRNLRAVEELARQCDHAIDQIGLDQGLADLAFAGLVGAHAAVGEHEASVAVGREVVDEVLYPGEVGVAFGRHAVLPAHVVVFAVPVAVVERRVGQHVVGAQIRVQIAAEGVGVFGAKVGLYAADGEVHHREAAGGGVAFLAVDGDVAHLAAVGFDELLRLHEHAAGTAAGIVDAAFIGFQHFHQTAHHAARRVELAAVLALGAGEAGKEILVDAAEQIDRTMRLGAAAGGGEFDGGDYIDQLAQALLIQSRARVVLGQHALEPRVDALNGDHRIVDPATDAGHARAGLQVRPARIGRHPENVLGQILVRILRIGAGVVALPRHQLGAVRLEAVGDVLQKDQPEHDMLVLRRVHVVAQLVRRQPELGLEAEIGAAGGLFLAGLGGFCCFGHGWAVLGTWRQRTMVGGDAERCQHLRVGMAAPCCSRLAAISQATANEHFRDRSTNPFAGARLRRDCLFRRFTGRDVHVALSGKQGNKLIIFDKKSKPVRPEQSVRCSIRKRVRLP